MARKVVERAAGDGAQGRSPGRGAGGKAPAEGFGGLRRSNCMKRI